MKCRIILSIILCCFVKNSFSQTVFSGTIKDEKTKETLPEILCRITDTQQKKYLGYGLTDINGQYRLSINSKADTVLLSFSAMGYETKTYIVPNITQEKDISLKEKPYELKEVTVAPPVIWKRGDTLNYNVEKLKSAQDNYIVDVLKKLPGIEVSDNGLIKYQGKAINKFYIEGLDLMGNKYNIASNNIPVEAIENVQVFENHQPIKALKDISASDAAALNLMLKKSYKMKPIINATAGTGFSAEAWLRFLNLMCLQIRKNRQSLITAKLNNVGIDLSNELTEHDISGSSNLNSQNDLFTPKSSSVPKNIIKPSRFNDSYLITYNDLVRLTDNAQIRLIASYLNEKEWRDYEIHNNYYIDANDSWTIDEDGRLTNHDNKGGADINFTLNDDKLYIENALKLSGSWNTAHTLISGTYPNSQSFYLPLFTLSNDLNIIKQHNKNTYSISSFINYNNQPQSLRIQSDSLSLGDAGLLKQNTNKKSFYTKSNISLSRSAGYSVYLLDVNLETDINTFKSNMYPEMTFESYNNENRLDYDKYNLTVKPQYRFIKESLNAGVSLPLNFIFLHNNNKINPDKNDDKFYCFLAPSVFIKYGIDKYWDAILSYNYNKQTGDILDFADGLRFLNYQTLYYGSGLYEVRSSHSYMSRILYRNSVDALFFNFMAIYRPSKSNMINGSSFINSNKITYKELMENKQDNYILVAKITKYIDPIKTNASLTGSYNHTKNKQYQQYLSYDITTNSYSISCNIDSKIGQKNSTSLNISYMGNKVKATSYSSDNLSQWAGNANWHFFPTKQWQLSLNCNYSCNELQNDRYANMLLMNMDIKYKKTKWELVLSGHNLLNKKEYTIINYDGLDTFFSRYNLRSREVLATIRFKL